ncbi:MAG: NAD(P)H-dependent flavin oxidoreductase [Promethearchaeota archaeon]|jgi:enoyl-[acyl-carrier protein] reductase II
MVIETNITKMLGIKHPIIGAPMGPFYTTELTKAISEAGGLGVLSHTNLFGGSPIEEMKKNMLEVVEHTDKPFGFNIRTARMQPDAPSLCRKIPQFIMSNPKIKEQCRYVVTSAGSPKMLRTRTFQKLRDSGSKIKHFHVAPALWLADKCMAAEVDGMIITGTEGGGHQSYEKVSTLVLLQQVVQKYPNVPVIACGGFASGQGVASALAMGAGAVAMGSRFIASKESEFHENYKKIIPPAKAQDTVLVTGFFGPIRLWKNKYALSHDLVASKEEKIAIEQGLTAEEMREQLKKGELAYQGNIEDGSILLGQSIGIVNNIERVSDIIDRLIREAEVSLKHAYDQIK